MILRKNLENLKNLKPGDTMDLVAGEGIRMTFSRFTKYYFIFSLDGGGDAFIDVRDNGSVYVLIWIIMIIDYSSHHRYMD